MVDEVKPKRGRGRPPLVLSFDAIRAYAALGMRDEEIAKAVRCSVRSLYRFLDGIPHGRDEIDLTRSMAAAQMLEALTQEALAGRVGAANMLLRRMGKL
jgi:hypothetical protein